MDANEREFQRQRIRVYARPLAVSILSDLSSFQIQFRNHVEAVNLSRAGNISVVTDSDQV